MSDEWPEDDRARRERHAPAFCIIKTGDNFFHGTMSAHCGQWVPRYTCPICGRQMRMASNYLGRNGHLMCIGDRFLKPHQQTLEQALRARDRAAVQTATI